jgi:hypothetical protein
MIFVLLILFIFGGLLVYANYGGMRPNAALPAQLLADNMATWHQAAMLQVENATPGTFPNCTSAVDMCAKDLNDFIWDRPSQTPIGPLAAQWPGYRSMVRAGLYTGWQSFYLWNINAHTPGVVGGEYYVLTIFRGFGGDADDSTVDPQSDETKAQAFVRELSQSITERVGLGMITCDGTPVVCTFSRLASQVNPGDTSMTSDVPLRFQADLFYDGATAPFVLAGRATEMLDGKPAMMTRVARRN